MLATQASGTAGIGRQTLRVIDIISAWVVNAFYNYLHQEAVALHIKGRTESITDGYRYIVKEYLASYNTQSGYKRLVNSLYQYYVDITHSTTTTFDEWMREVLGQFVPVDYKQLMCNDQQDQLLRNILVNSVMQFSSDVLCTPLLDLLISNHDEPSIVPQMKKAMKAALISERCKIFNGIHNASTGADPAPTSAIKGELRALVEENVILKGKNATLAANIKRSLEGLKMREKLINDLKLQNAELQRRISAKPQAMTSLPPLTPVDTFKTTVQAYDGAIRPHQPQRGDEQKHEVDARREPVVSMWPAVAQMNHSAQAPLSYNERTVPEKFATKNDEGSDASEEGGSDAENEEDPDDKFTTAEAPTGSDRLELGMDDFMNG